MRGPNGSGTAHTIVWDIRLQRALGALLVGAILGGVGSAFQGLLRNPLAEPYIIGVSSGSAVGGALSIVLHWELVLGPLARVVPGFATGMLTLLLVLALARHHGQVNVKTLLLAGVVVGTLLSALLSMILLLGQRESQVLGFLLGSLLNMQPIQNGLLLVVLVFGSIALVLQTRKLNAFSLGEETAQRLGLDTRKLLWTVLTIGAAMTAAVVGTVGIIGFLGLVAPHISRRVVGLDWRYSLPGSILLGSLLLLLSDLVAQRFFSTITHTEGMDLPVGIVTALLGAPSLLVLLRKNG